MEIQTPTYSNYFGVIDKVIWFRVTDNFSNFNVNLSVRASRDKEYKITIQNRASLSVGFEFSTNIPKNAAAPDINKNVKILHIPLLKAREYVIINEGL